MDIERYHPEGIATPSGVWSTAVKVKAPGDLVFLAGFTSRDENGAVFGVGDIAAQTRRVCEQMQIAMHTAGGELSDIVRVDVYIRDMKDFDTIHKVRREFFPKDPPASTMVEISRLVGDESLIEITAMAVLP